MKKLREEMRKDGDFVGTSFLEKHKIKKEKRLWQSEVFGFEKSPSVFWRKKNGNR